MREKVRFLSAFLSATECRQELRKSSARRMRERVGPPDDGEECIPLYGPNGAVVGPDEHFTGPGVPVQRQDRLATVQHVALVEVPGGYRLAHACHTAPHRPQEYWAPYEMT